MSSDIEKSAVFDDRIVQTRPRYAVEKGALSLTNSPFAAISQSQSQHTYNVYVPSENVYVARDVDWSSTCNLAISVQLGDTAGGQFPIGQPLLELGVDGSLAAFPLNSLCATVTATINDTTVVINSQDVLTEVLRLTDNQSNRAERTCPTMLDKYQSNADGLNAINDPMAGYTTMGQSYCDVPNGAYANIVFTNAQGAALTGSGSYTDVNGVTINYVAGTPVSTDQGAGVVNGLYTVYLRFRSTEKICLSPFIFNDSHSEDTGLFGINNIQMVMNLRDPNRAIRLRDSYVGTTTKLYYGGGATPSLYTAPVSYNTASVNGVFQDSFLNMQFLTPSLDIPLPPKSIVPYMEFPRFITQNQNGGIEAGKSVQLQSQTITLPQIPDLLIIYCKALYNAVNSDRSLDPQLPQWGSGYLPMETSANSEFPATRTVQPLSINFDNFSGLLSSHTSEQLYHMSVKNGLNMDWETWSGVARVPNGGVGGRVPTVGGFLVLKPSKDVTLQSGQAPSLVGNFTLQFNIRVTNTFPFTVTPQLFVITANSGFLESIRGSSRIIKGVLSEQDIIAAPLAPQGTHASLARYVGGNMLPMANRLGMVRPEQGQTAQPPRIRDALPLPVSRPQHRGQRRGLSERLM
jgi:hypothetical protein